MAYILDADVFIQAQNRHYGFDFCPAFWDWILFQYAAGKLWSIRQVLDELTVKDDDVSKWSKKHSVMFIETTESTEIAMLEVMQYIQDQGFKSSDLNEFMKGADCRLIAYAKAHGHIVVSQEASSSKYKKIKVPKVCDAMGVPFMTTFVMLRHGRARFVLDNALRIGT